MRGCIHTIRIVLIELFNDQHKCYIFKILPFGITALACEFLAVTYNISNGCTNSNGFNGLMKVFTVVAIMALLTVLAAILIRWLY